MTIYNVYYITSGFKTRGRPGKVDIYACLSYFLNFNAPMMSVKTNGEMYSH